jgi:hypothetical protein
MAAHGTQRIRREESIISELGCIVYIPTGFLHLVSSAFTMIVDEPPCFERVEVRLQ